MTQAAWIIPLLPLAAFVLITAAGPRLPGRGAYVSIAGIVLAGIAGLVVLGEVIGGARADVTYTWAVLGAKPITVGFVVDPLSAIMLAMVGVVASLITIYSVGYMAGDPHYPRFFAYLSLFQFSMLFLILADNFLFIYAGWELVGLCSYLLIGFWFERPAAARAALKAFITTRVGDFSMMIGILIIFLHTGSLRFDEVFKSIQGGALAGPLLTAAAVLVFGGAVGKSARCRCTSGCPTRWRVPRRSARSSTPRRWSPPACTSWRAPTRSSCSRRTTPRSPSSPTSAASPRSSPRRWGWWRTTSSGCWRTRRSASWAT